MLQTIVVIAEIIAGILGFVKKDEVAELLGGVAEESMVLWNCTGSECNDVALAWDSIQVKTFIYLSSLSDILK